MLDPNEVPGLNLNQAQTTSAPIIQKIDWGDHYQLVAFIRNPN